MSTVFASKSFFRLKIDAFDLGSFTTCSGLSAEMEMEQYAQGGENGFVRYFPTRVKWSNLTLTRTVTTDGTAKVLNWLTSLTQRVKRGTGEVVALHPNKKTVIARWDVHGIVPVRWQGPDFDSSTSAAGVERLELAHEGLVQK